jgi:hypothetical protein
LGKSSIRVQGLGYRVQGIEKEILPPFIPAPVIKPEMLLRNLLSKLRKLLRVLMSNERDFGCLPPQGMPDHKPDGAQANPHEKNI